MARMFGLQVWTILWKDMRYEVRSKQTWLGMGMFVLLVLVIFNFTFDLNTSTVVAIAPGALWVAFIFASLLGLGRTVVAEQEQATMDRLLITPVDRKAIYLAKLLGNLLFIGVVEIIALPVFAVLFNLSIWQAPTLLELILIELLGALGIASVGTLFSVMAAVTRAKELLMPILIFPLVVPVVISAVRATTNLLAPVSGDPPWLGLLIAFDVIFLCVSTLLFQFVVEE
jgi:heme exporter protein B